MTKSKFFSIVSVSLAVLCMAVASLPLARPAEAVVISNLEVVTVTDTSATIVWNTDIVADALIEYGAGGNMTDAVDDATLKTSHSLLLLGLKPGTQYTFKASSADADGEVAYAQDGSFKTTGTAGTGVTVPPATQTESPSAGLYAPVPVVVSPTPVPVATVPMYPTGTLANEKGTIYFLMARDMVKIPFTSMKAFTGLGYSLKNVVKMDLSSYRSSGSYFLNSSEQEHPWGSCLVYADGTVYYYAEEGMVGIPSMEIAQDLQCADKLVPMNMADNVVWEKNPNLPVMQLGDARKL